MVKIREKEFVLHRRYFCRVQREAFKKLVVNHTIIQVGRDLWRSACPISFSKQG